ncbi:hypothetical protein BGX34_010269 [Mortierella sp. NVP85]|nr:hypothetical protein BGX34_010269 [Mortierella sp. NVP85]
MSQPNDRSGNESDATAVDYAALGLLNEGSRQGTEEPESDSDRSSVLSEDDGLPPALGVNYRPEGSVWETASEDFADIKYGLEAGKALLAYLRWSRAYEASIQLQCLAREHGLHRLHDVSVPRAPRGTVSRIALLTQAQEEERRCTEQIEEVERLVGRVREVAEWVRDYPQEQRRVDVRNGKRRRDEDEQEEGYAGGTEAESSSAAASRRVVVVWSRQRWCQQAELRFIV